MITQKTTPNTIWKTGWITMMPMMRHGMTGGKIDATERSDPRMEAERFVSDDLDTDE